MTDLSFFEATGEYVAVLALGRDLNGDGLLRALDGELGPSFGVSDRNFLVQEANEGTSHTDNFNAGGGDGNSGNDW
jgi:DNA-binding LytR/AlgR family response regulator